MKSLFFTIACSLVSLTPAYAQQLVACDLIDVSVAGKILSAELKEHSPNRATQKFADNATVSDCIFFAKDGRKHLRVTLAEYPSTKEAEKQFVQSSGNTSFVKQEPAPNFGDAARWWSIEQEASGLTIHKGRWALVFDIRWKDANIGQVGAKERIGPPARVAASKLGR